MPRTLASCLGLALAAAGCGGVAPAVARDDHRLGTMPAAARSEALHMPCCSWLRVEGTAIVDESGREVLLKGLFLSNNTWGNWVSPISDDLQRQGKYPLIPPREQDAWVLTDVDFGIFAELSLNHVVYALNYELFAADNDKRAANLAKLLAHVERFNSLGIYVTILFASGPGLNVSNGGFYAEVPGPQRLKTVFEDAVFQDQHVEFIRYVVAGTRDRPGVAGYGLVDEPMRPSDADGGLVAFRAGCERFCREIRALDPRHVIFVQGYNGREANPGEQYWDNKSGSFRIDRGEQAFTGPADLVQLDAAIGNLAYDIHTFVPYEFTSLGAPDFDPAVIDATVRQWVAKAHDQFHAPLIVSSYGIDTKQPPQNRIRWLNAIHEVFGRQRMSVAYFHYKDHVGCSGQDVGFGVYVHCDGAAIAPWDPGVVEAFQTYWSSR